MYVSVNVCVSVLKREKLISVPLNNFLIQKMHFIAKQHNEVFWSIFFKCKIELHQKYIYNILSKKNK